MGDDDLQLRATFEDTKRAQEMLRKTLEELEKENRSIKDDKERDTLFNLLADAFLGLDDRSFKYYPPNDKTVILNFGGFFRRVLYYNNNNITDRLGDGENKTEKPLVISEIWKWLKFKSFYLYPGALAMAARMSKEQKGIYPESESQDYDNLR